LKYLVVIAVAGLLWMLLVVVLYRKLRPYLLTLRNFLHAIRQFQTQGSRNKTRGEVEKLVCCTACGVWVPQTRALISAGSRDLWYCSDECRRGTPKAVR
jgi:hypothetical protein